MTYGNSVIIQFEYNIDTDMVTLYEWGANYLGAKELIMHPFDDEKMSDILSASDMANLRS